MRAKVAPPCQSGRLRPITPSAPTAPSPPRDPAFSASLRNRRRTLSGRLKGMPDGHAHMLPYRKNPPVGAGLTRVSQRAQARVCTRPRAPEARARIRSPRVPFASSQCAPCVSCECTKRLQVSHSGECRRVPPPTCVCLVRVPLSLCLSIVLPTLTRQMTTVSSCASSPSLKHQGIDPHAKRYVRRGRTGHI
jgi:hypothetical protein